MWGFGVPDFRGFRIWGFGVPDLEGLGYRGLGFGVLGFRI